MKRRVFFTIIFFLLIYFPPIMKVNIVLLVEGLLLLLTCLSFFKEKKLIVFRSDMTFFCSYSLLILYQGFLSVLNGYSFMDSNSDNMLILLGFFFSSYMLRRQFTIYEIRDSELVDMVIIAGIVQSVFAIVAFINRDFQHWFITRMIDYGYSESRFTQLASFRWFGIATQLGFATPVVQVFLSLISIYFGITKNKRYFAAAPLLLFSAIINARLSIIIFFVGGILVIYRIFKEYSKKEASRKLLKYSIITSVLTIVGFRVLYSYSYDTYVWVVYGIMDFLGIDAGGITSGVYGVGDYFINSKNYLLPTELELITGIGVNLSKSRISYRTDIGYIIDIWKYGLFITPLLYIYVIKLTKILNRIRDPISHVLRGLVLIVLTISNIKGNIISATPITAIIVLFLFGFPHIKSVGSSIKHDSVSLYLSSAESIS